MDQVFLDDLRGRITELHEAGLYKDERVIESPAAGEH